MYQFVNQQKATVRSAPSPVRHVRREGEEHAEPAGRAVPGRSGQSTGHQVPQTVPFQVGQAHVQQHHQTDHPAADGQQTPDAQPCGFAWK